MIELTARPRLAPKVKLRFDRISQQYLLLVPEKGLALNRTASAIAQLCTGEYSVRGIIERLMQQHVEVTEAQLQLEVLGFLQQLDQRGMLEVFR